MKYIIKILTVFLVTILFFSCAGVRPTRRAPEAPIIRVGVLEHRDKIEFSVDGDFYLITKSPGKKFRFSEKGTWLVSVYKSRPAKTISRILVYESSRLKNVEDYLRNRRSQNPRLEMKTSGDVLRVGAKVIAEKKYYRLFVARDFDSRAEAETYLQTTPGLQSARVIEDIVEPATGKIKLLSPSGRMYGVENVFRIIRRPVKLKDVDVGTGYHWAHNEDRTYRGEMEFRIDNEGKLTAINVLPLEDYLRGVVPGEMSTNFPLEALKAQAVAARTFFLFNFARTHRHDPFDVCDDVHCQAFVGLGKESSRTNQAIRATRGLVLTYNGQLCSTPYAAVCGGHTESAENVWDSDGEPYLQGIYDIDPRLNLPAHFDLSDEENVRKWINARPNVLCNIENEQADFAGYTQKYFRWQYRVPREELERIISQKTGQTIGTLRDIIPIRRGISGRLMEIQIKGSLGSVVIKKELNIRKTLADNTLYSACFFVEKQGGNSYAPKEFIFRGAGWGHGVGMCQTGASIMALKGYSFVDILKHYYQGAVIKRLY